MIRIIIALIALFVVWVLFFSGFSKDRKIVTVVLSIALSLFGFWFESDAGKPKVNIVNVADVKSCGVSAVHSYRSNFDITLCVHNKAAQGHIKRLGFSVIANQCDEFGSCNELQRVRRDLTVDLPVKESQTIKQNLSFSEVNRDLQGIEWSLEIHSVKASQ